MQRLRPGCVYCVCARARVCVVSELYWFCRDQVSFSGGKKRGRGGEGRRAGAKMDCGFREDGKAKGKSGRRREFGPPPRLAVAEVRGRCSVHCGCYRRSNILEGEGQWGRSALFSVFVRKGGWGGGWGRDKGGSSRAPEQRPRPAAEERRAGLSRCLYSGGLQGIHPSITRYHTDRAGATQAGYCASAK